MISIQGQLSRACGPGIHSTEYCKIIAKSVMLFCLVSVKGTIIWSASTTNIANYNIADICKLMDVLLLLL